ncbi:MAG: cell division protein SepF [Clostridia bacterium]|nr:cell division protein SepF [Clostridia bacterium]
MNFIEKMKGLIYTDNEEKDEQDAVNNNTRPFEQTRAQAESNAASNVSVTSGTSIEMKVIRPEKLDSVTQIADYLTSRNTVLLNLEGTNKETARRLLDFLNGVAYAVGGKLKKVANSTFVITPSNVSISGENIADTSDHEAI